MRPVRSAHRRMPRTIARAVIANMHESLVPMVYTTVTPTSYVVYVHPDDFAEIEGVVPALSGQINRALDEAIDRLACPRWWDHLLRPGREALPPIEAPPGRTVEIVPDPNGEVEPGEVSVHSELRLAAGEYAGAPTVRVTAATAPPHASAVHVVPPAPAVLTIEDIEGWRQHPLVDNPTLVGRGGVGCYVHARVRAEGVVSKEHCRLRRDEHSGQFFIKDLSRHGTFVNGERLPPGADFSSGQKRELDCGEVPLPDGARIGLAGALSLEFRRVTP